MRKNPFFKVQGSAEEPYDVVFALQADNLTASCSCKAGTFGMHCKHRIRLLNGDTTGLVGDNSQDVATLLSWIPGTDVETALKDLVALEKEAAAVKRKLSAAKKRLAKALLD